MDWISVLPKGISLKVLTQTLGTKGNLVYEYNPFRNYRLSGNMYEFRNSLYSLYDLYKNYGLLLDVDSGVRKVCCSTGDTRCYYAAAEPVNGDVVLTNTDLAGHLDYCHGKGGVAARKSFERALVDARLTKWQENALLRTESDPVLHECGELTDFITGELGFSLDHPVSLVPQYSYDGSVNLVLNDGKNAPRLINSRFSATGRDTYEIVDRKGDNDTNIYDQGDQFDVDTSLYKRTTGIPKLDFRGVCAGGNLPVGNYHFYFKFADADGNETDFVAESGLVSLFLGFDIPQAVSTGVSGENSTKSVRFTLTDIDAGYCFVHVYYSRNSAQPDQSRQVQYCRVDKNYVVSNTQRCNIVVTGFETMLDISASDINLQYNVASAAAAAVACQNMLLLGNIHKPDIPYRELTDLSLRFLPYVKETVYPLEMDRNYNITSTSRGYYDPKYIYSSTGYWGGEYYRFGVVYILPDNSLSPVFNIRGRCGVCPFGGGAAEPEKGSVFYGNKVNDGQYNHYGLYDGDGGRVYINSNESTFYVLDPSAGDGVVALDRNYYENSKGVVSFRPLRDTDRVYALDVRCDDSTMQELKKLVKGWFFVRQERIPTILCQGITVGLDNNAFVPTLPTQGGVLTDMAKSLDGGTYVEVDDINDVNYVSESFITRYSFTLEKSSSGYWATFGKIVAAVAIVAAVVVASVVTCGAAAVAAGVVAAVTVTTAATTAVIAAGAAVAAVAVTGATVGAAVEASLAIQRKLAVKKLKGRHTEIPTGYKREETDDSRVVGGAFRDRLVITDPKYNMTGALLCPDYELDQPYYNQIFTGGKHVLQLANSQSINRLQGYGSDFFSNDGRHFYIPSYYDAARPTSKASAYTASAYTASEFTCRLQGVPDDVPLVGIGNRKYRSRAGFAEEAWHYEAVGREFDGEEETINAEIVRGSYGPYVAVDGYPQRPCDTVNVMVPGYSSSMTADYVGIRMDDDSSYFAISDRMAVRDSDSWLTVPLTGLSGDDDRSGGYSWELYRGDCFLCQVTHRLNRNFNDPSAPYNHDIIDNSTWKNGYDPENTDKYLEINLGDVNAVQLGMWVTFRIRSSSNLNIRTVDNSYTDERLMCGHGRGHFPYLPMDTEGNYKIPESAVYNAGFRKTVSERYNFAVPDVPYVKNWFGTRIMYSDIHVNDAFKNGFRVFRGSSYIDCPRTYGEIVKLVNVQDDIIVVFEHGIGVIKVIAENSARSVAGGHDYLNVSPVLSQPVIISDVLGSQWADSVMSTPGNFGDGRCYVYGVDTVAKKIWRVSGAAVDCISDMRVQEFMNRNMTLGERENTPLLGIRNVKTCYNSFKKDVLFTFYDNLSGFEENVWNLCWNETLQNFITFYSWVPSFMENINYMPFSFNRDTSRWIAKLGMSHADNSFADGITLTNNIIENNWTSEVKGTDAVSFKADIMQAGSATPVETLLTPFKGWMPTDPTDESWRDGLIGILGVTGMNMPSGKDIIYKTEFSLERDNFGNHKCFEIREIGWYVHKYDNSGELAAGAAAINLVRIPVYGLYLRDGVTVPGTLASELYYRNKAGNAYSDWETNMVKPVLSGEAGAVTLAAVMNTGLPVFKNRSGKRLTLPREDMINPTHIVRLLNVRATVYGYYGGMDPTVSEYFYNYARGKASTDSSGVGTHKVESTTGKASGTWVDCGFYESVVAVIPRWNMQFLTTDFWKHGQAGLQDIADGIYPAHWYGTQHPFEFEFVVRNDASTHKIFTNLEIVSNKVKPESFHFEFTGDVYSFSKDKANMYFRQEAMRALYQFNGADLRYDRNFLETQPRQNKVSADLPHEYFARQDTFNEIYDSYRQATAVGKDYDHITGSEILYYPDRKEYRIWMHQKAVSMDDFEGDSTMRRKYTGEDGVERFVYEDDGWEGARALIASNCRYKEDRWRAVINPVVVCYRNEYDLGKGGLSPDNSLWTDPNRPPLPVFNSPLPSDGEGNRILGDGLTDDGFPPELRDIGYTLDDLDSVRWLDDVDIHGYSWGGEGTACNREEVSVRDKFVKIRIRYTGDQLAVIDFINTIYQLSLA